MLVQALITGLLKPPDSLIISRQWRHRAAIVTHWLELENAKKYNLAKLQVYAGLAGASDITEESFSAIQSRLFDECLYGLRRTLFPWYEEPKPEDPTEKGLKMWLNHYGTMTQEEINAEIEKALAALAG